MDSLIVPAIEVYVGAATSIGGSADSFVTWSLPKRLISYHSPFLAAACDRDFKERHENLIKLPDDNPIVFALSSSGCTTELMPSNPCRCLHKLETTVSVSTPNAGYLGISCYATTSRTTP